MKKNKTMTLKNKKSNNIPAASAAPAVKNNSPKGEKKTAEQIRNERNARKAEAAKAQGKKEETRNKRIVKTVTKKSAPPIESKLIVCVFNKRDEGIKVDIKVKDKKGNEKTIEKTYHGAPAAKIAMEKANLVPEILTGTYCALKVPLEDAQKAVDALSPYGRVSIPTVYRTAGIDAKTAKKKRKKKPTNNTAEAKLTAKKARKLNNLARHNKHIPAIVKVGEELCEKAAAKVGKKLHSLRDVKKAAKKAAKAALNTNKERKEAA